MTLRVFASPDVRLESGLEGQEIVLDSEESHYLVRVRRARAGDNVQLSDGHRWWPARVLDPRPKAARLRLSAYPVDPPEVAPVSLLLGLPDPKTVLELLPGACELGVAEVVLARCARSQTDGPGPSRIDRVLRASVRQCGRPTPPRVVGPLRLDRALDHGDAPGVVAVAPGRHQLVPVGRAVAALDGCGRFAVGPEGGFEPGEVDACVRAGLTPVSLGPWVLRTQTAALAMLAHLSLLPPRRP